MKLLIVDDILDNIKVAMNHLKPLGCEFIYATSGKQALERALIHHPDLILMDVMMPEMDGYETVIRLKQSAETASIPVIYLTAKIDPKDIARGFECGGVDYVTKPFSGAELLARVRTHLELRRYQNHLERLVSERTQEVEKLRNAVIEALGGMAEYRDPETGGHIKRTQHYVRELAQRLYEKGKFLMILNPEYIQTLFLSAPLHDIGKVGIRDHILLKPASLTPEEFEEMKRHTLIGEQAIAKLIHNAGECEFLSCALEIAGSHHERFDGSGYPRGLAGEAIPLSARIMALADVYDALVNKRVYKEAWSHERAMQVMRAGRGSHFDPQVFDTFLELEERFIEIYETFRDD